jgi:fructose-1,6-bisphosphatase
MKMFKVKPKKLDVISNDYLIDALKVHPQVVV